MLRRIYLSSFIFTIALALTAYIGSTFIAVRLGEVFVGLTYTIAALVTLTLLEILPTLITRFGNRNIILGLLGVNALSLIFLIGSVSHGKIIAAFITYQITTTLIWYCFDIFIEHFSKNEHVGTIRGTYLSLTNFAWMLTPLLGGFLLTRSGFGLLFCVALIATITVSVLVALLFESYHDTHYKHLSGFGAFRYLHKRPDLASAVCLNFVLQFFYAWMVIYTPLYLEKQGFSFETIGFIFTLMLSAFVILQYPLGHRSDTVGEKKMLSFGLLIMGGATILFALTHSPLPLLFGGILFLTRVGAATVEVMSETYFFKRVTDSDTEIISLFRTARPLAYVIAPVLGSLILIGENYTALFLVLGIGILCSLLLTRKLNAK